MKKLIYAFLAIDVVIFAFLSMNGGLKGAPYDLAPQVFFAAVESGDAALIDVRTIEEYENIHIPGAENVNWKSGDFKDRIQTIKKDQPVYIYCRSGMRASRAKRMMNKLGYDEVYNLKGGLIKWSKDDLPVKVKPGYNVNFDDGEEGC